MMKYDVRSMKADEFINDGEIKDTVNYANEHKDDIEMVEKILEKANVNPDTRVRDLTDDEVIAISRVIEESEMLIEGDLRRETAMNIKRLQEVGCYRGIRHRRSLPVRGQNTKNNARTRKGPRKTVANKKK